MTTKETEPLQLGTAVKEWHTIRRALGREPGAEHLTFDHFDKTTCGLIYLGYVERRGFWRKLLRRKPKYRIFRGMGRTWTELPDYRDPGNGIKAELRECFDMLERLFQKKERAEG